MRLRWLAMTPRWVLHMCTALMRTARPRGGVLFNVFWADLLAHFPLDLKPRREVADDAVVFGQADDFAVHGGQHPDVGVAVDRHEVVRAGGPQFDRPRDDQLVVAL